ncbi:hypothetical protein TcasGA2_TC032910 [Tribolium castaneum]|uniref:Uncharacterized protein n=1 Tax=Tribolium castaneum TaxID=7070 RepID=A0A139WJU5_TRICA|nr:hypothetical protein TcasGA2_TC032910 [Tribolium castaneum]
MSKTCRQKFVRIVVYFMIFSNIVGGLCSIVTRGIAPLSGLFLMLGLLAIAGGLVLLAGVIKGNDRFILVYLILAIMVIAFTTVLISVLIIPKVKEVKGHVFVVVYFLLIIWWPILYCVYLFYKDLLSTKTMEVPAVEIQTSGEKCDVVVHEETSEGTSV